MPRIRFLFLFLLSALALDLGNASAADASSTQYRTNLLLYRDRKGTEAVVRNVRDWAKRRAEIVSAMEKVMGPLPGKEKRCALVLKTDAEVDRGAYVERFIRYQSEPGSSVPAYLLVPKQAPSGKRTLPAILALHPTDMEHGHRTVVEQMRANYRAYGRDLVERGYVVLAPSYPLMANYQPDLKALGYKSGTMKAIWDNMRGLDLLESLPYVEKKRFGAIGHSLGGHNSIYTAVFDPRIRVVVSSCGFDSYRDYMNGEIKGWTSERYMPALLNYSDRLDTIPFDFYEMIGALSPRPVFVNAPLKDSNFKWQSVDRIMGSAREVYRLEHHEERLKVVHPDCAHDFPSEIREEAYAFIDSVLR